jgi:hypothetical protein
MLPLLLFAAAVTFDAGFEGGSLGAVETIAPDHYRAHLRGDVDQDKWNRQANWYYFRVDGARGRELTIDLVDLPGEYNYKPNKGAITEDTPPFYSEDGQTWKPLDTADYDASVPLLRLRVKLASNRFWIAHQPPYTNKNVSDLLDAVRGNAAASIRTIGKAPEGRDIPLLTITDSAAPDSGKKAVWILFRQHAWESGSSWADEGAVRFLLSDTPEAVQIRRSMIFNILPMCDPDGVAHGRVRFNASGYDLNRNWDTHDPAKTPEISAERDAILARGRIDLLVTVHNTEMSEYLEGPPGEEYTPLLKRFEAALSRSGVFQQSRPASLASRSTEPGTSGRMSVHQGLYNDRKIPAFLIEQRISKHPKTGRHPGIEDREQFGADLVRAINETLR